MMDKLHKVQSTKVDNTYLYLTVDGQSYRIRWIDCSPRLARATLEQRKHLEVSPSGYGIHWPDIDEDISAEGMLYGIPAPRPRISSKYSAKSKQKKMTANKSLKRDAA